MADQHGSAPTDMGVFAKQAEDRWAAGDVLAIVLTLVWIGVVVLFYMVLSDPSAVDHVHPMTNALVALAVALPVAMIWLVALVAKRIRSLQAQIFALQGLAERLRAEGNARDVAMRVRPAPPMAAVTASAPVFASTVAPSAEVEAGTDPMSESASAEDGAGPVVSFARHRAVSDDAPEEVAEPAQTAERAPEVEGSPVAPAVSQALTEDEPRLAFGADEPAEETGLSAHDYIRALHFPLNENDTEGFDVLKRALGMPTVARVVRAAQDVLTLLSEDGIYMDDLIPDRARPDVWRRFAAGERGRAVAGLSGVRDRSSLALSAGRMRSDAIFRDAVHHFLRQFDQGFVRFEATASDSEIVRLAETRTARAFMLLGRVAGTFD